MVELWISLVRNVACVLKSLLPADHAAMQPLMTFPDLLSKWTAPGQLERFTSLEGLIGLLQLAGACFNIQKGFKGLGGGVVMAEYIVRWRNALEDYAIGSEGKVKEVEMLSDVLGRQDAANNRRIIAGICQLVIGAGLLCLTCFSWKLVGIITTATAVAILEVALAVLLTMGVAGVLKMWTVTTKVQGLERPTASNVDVIEFLVPLSTSDSVWEPDVRVPPTAAALREHMEGMSTIAKVVSESRPEDVQHLAQEARKQAALDAFLILLNVAAFVGYGTIPLDVFFPERSLLTDWLPPGSTAWWGNFVGDVAWTIEPITLFLAPYVFLRRAQLGASGKRKAD